ncbi:unnamed protein product, partial [Prorocentrum cordatum]
MCKCRTRCSTVQGTINAWTRLGRNKGVGPDGLPAEFLVAAAPVMAPFATELYNDVIKYERWPVSWTGGRMQDIFKNKGDRAVCDDSRGIILEDHLAKGLKQHLAQSVMPAYTAHQPPAQHGAVHGRSTDFATHFVREALEYAASARLCIFVLFMDLVKAFDRIVREVTLGWPAGADDPRAYLASLGLQPRQADWIATFVAVHGCLLEEWGVPRKVVRLLKNMHAQSWFSYGDVDEAVATREAGIVLSLASDSLPPWTQAAPSAV